MAKTVFMQFTKKDLEIADLWFQCRTPDEIEKELGISRGTLQVRLGKVRKKLKQGLAMLEESEK